MTDAAEEIVATAGVTSHVFEDGEVCGHVLLLDLDGVGFLDAVKVADDLDGVTAVLRSSEGSHHVWSLDVRPLREQTVRALSYHAADDAHVGASWRRGYAVLRVVGKVEEDGATYKRPPTVRHVSPSGASGPHSAPHAAMLRSLVEDGEEEPQGTPAALDGAHAPESVGFVGDADDLRLDAYQTLTDEGKATLSGGA